MKTDAAGAGRSIYLPDFCTSRASLVVILIVELTALVLTLARQNASIDFWGELARTSFFLLWIGLAAAGLLCLVHENLTKLNVTQGSAVVFALIAAVISIVSAFAIYVGRTEVVNNLGVAELFPHDAGPFVLRNVLIGLIITALALRYFFVTHEWRRNVEMRAAARVHAEELVGAVHGAAREEPMQHAGRHG